MLSSKGKPHVGARVSIKRRVIAGVEHSDTGTITRLEDGGYCVVRWDSDGESRSVLMTSLRPLADNDYSEGFDDAARVARVLNSVTSMPTSETTITVESALAELREMCPYEPFTIWIHGAAKRLDVEIIIDGVRRASVYNSERGLEEAMAQVREWRRNND